MSPRRRSRPRKYGPAAARKVGRVMREWKRGELVSGRSGRRVTSRKQAIAIGISEARRAGAKVPPMRKARRTMKTKKTKTSKSRRRA